MAPTIPVWPSHFIFQAEAAPCGAARILRERSNLKFQLSYKSPENMIYLSTELHKKLSGMALLARQKWVLVGALSCLLLLVTVLRLSSSDYFTSQELAESTSTSMSLHVFKAVAIEFNQISLIKETQQSNQKLQTCHHVSQLHSRLIVLRLFFTDHRLGIISKRGWSALILYLHSHQDINDISLCNTTKLIFRFTL